MDRSVRRAVWGSLVLAGVFWLVIQVTKEVPALNRREPWQDDPYDAMVSFMMSAVPLWTVLCAVRLPFLYRQPENPLRAVQVVRALAVQSRLIEVTLLVEWVALAAGAHRADWTATTGVLVAVLTALSLAAVVVARRQAAVPRPRAAAGDDWFGDVLALSRSAAARLGPFSGAAERVVGGVERRLVRPLRRHPVLVTGALGLAGGLVVELPQIVLEQYRPGLAALVVLISAASLFAFLVIAGAHLGMVVRRGPAPAWLHALLAASLALPLAAVFRVLIWRGLGIDPDQEGVADLAWLVAGSASAVALIVLVLEGFRGRGRSAPLRGQPR